MNPLTEVTVIVDIPVDPELRLSDEGLAVRLMSGCAAGGAM